jgi:hypothetical protein
MSSSTSDTTAPTEGAQSAPIRTGRPTSTASRRQIVFRVVVILTYLVIGAIAFWPVLPRLDHSLFGVDMDYIQSVWFLSWIAHASTHAHDPFFSNAMYVPTGVNLAQNTASPLLALLATPLLLATNSVLATNVLMVLAMPLSATAAFLVLSKWKVWTPAAALGGLLYGFSPYMVGQALGHVELLFMPLPPLIAMTIVSLLRREGPPLRLSLQLGGLAAAQYLISPEVLATVALFACFALAAVAIRYRASVHDWLRRSGRPLLLGAAVAGVLLLYPVAMLLVGPQHLSVPTHQLDNPFHNDALSFVVPGHLQVFSFGTRPEWTGSMATFDPTETAGYLGIPVLAVLLFLAWRSRKSPRMQLTMFLLVSAAVLSLGPTLWVHGRSLHVPLPFAVLTHLPLLQNILPSRVSFELDAFVAAALAFGLSDLRHDYVQSTAREGGNGSARLSWRVGVVTAATLVVLVVTLLPRWPNPARPATSLPPAIETAIPPGSPVAITYPFATQFTAQPLLWQAQDAFGFRLLGGYAFHPNPVGSTLKPYPMHPPGLQQFLSFQDPPSRTQITYGTGAPVHVGPQLVAATRAALSKYGVQVVIVDRSTPGSGPVVALFTAVLGPPARTAGPFDLWTIERGRSSPSR